MKAIVVFGPGSLKAMWPLSLKEYPIGVPLCNKSNIEVLAEGLAAVGVNKIVLSLGHKLEGFDAYLAKMEAKFGVRVTVSRQESKVSVLSSICGAREAILSNNPEGLFYVIDSEVICDFPFKRMLKKMRELQ